MKVDVKWTQKELELDGYNDKTDDITPMRQPGPAPKHLFLQGIVGCTAMDVVAIMKKMRLDMPESFEVHLDSELADNHPKVFTTMHLTYDLKGTTNPERYVRAVELSSTMYCALSYMMKKICDVKTTVLYNGEELPYPPK